jgi:peptide/nickel transport system substrate-binding protein
MTLPITRRAGLAGLASLPFLPRAARAREAGTLVFGLSSYPPNLMPWLDTGTASATVKMQMFRGLLSFAPDGSLRGELASAWSHDDKGAWTFTLRDATFHNGEKVTSADVKWTIEQVAANAATRLHAEMASITSVETPDDRTVRLTTRAMTATLGEWFANSCLPIVSRVSDPKQPVGAGPFVLDSQERGSFVQLTAAPGYYKPGLPRTKTLRFVAYPDDTARVAALQAGDVDMIEYVPWQSIGELSKDTRLKVTAHDGPFMYLVFNGSRPPFDDARVRLAVAFAVKRDELIQGAFFGRGSPLGHLPIPNASPYFNADLKDGWHYDPARAKQLLADAGHPEGFACNMLATAQYGMHKDTAVLVQQQLAAIGIQATLTLPDWPTRIRMGAQGQYDLAVMGTGPDSNDPDGLSSVLDGSLPPALPRSYGLKTPKITALLQAGRETFDEAKRKAIYHEMEQAALADAPIVGLTWRDQAYAMAKDVSGFTNLPGMLTFMSGTTLENTAIG